MSSKKQLRIIDETEYIKVAEEIYDILNKNKFPKYIEVALLEDIKHHLLCDNR